MPVKSRLVPALLHLVGLRAGREGPLDLPLGVLDKGDSPRAPLIDGSGRYPAGPS